MALLDGTVDYGDGAGSQPAHIVEMGGGMSFPKSASDAFAQARKAFVTEIERILRIERASAASDEEVSAKVRVIASGE